MVTVTFVEDKITVPNLHSMEKMRLGDIETELKQGVESVECSTDATVEFRIYTNVQPWYSSNETVITGDCQDTIRKKIEEILSKWKPEKFV